MKTKKTAKQAKRKHTKGKKQGKLWPYLLAFAVLLGALFLKSRLPPSVGIWFTIGFKAAASVALLCLLIFKWVPERMPVCGVLNVLSAVLLLWTFLLPAKIGVPVALLLIAAGSVLAVIAQCKCTGFGFIYTLTVTLYPLKTLSMSEEMLFQSGAQMPYWLPALIAALLCGGVIALLTGKDLLHLEDERTSECVCLVILAAAAAFVIVQYGAVGLNSALDTSEPQIYSVQVTDKDTSSTRGGTTYYITTDSPDGELEFRVAQEEYRMAEIGDTVSLRLYDGAFGEPYYLLQTSGKEK